MYIIKYEGWYGFLKTFKLFRIFSEKNLIFTKLLGEGTKAPFGPQVALPLASCTPLFNQILYSVYLSKATPCFCRPRNCIKNDNTPNPCSWFLRLVSTKSLLVIPKTGINWADIERIIHIYKCETTWNFFIFFCKHALFSGHVKKNGDKSPTPTNQK